MALIEQLSAGFITRNANGELVKNLFAASAVKSTDGKTVEAHVTDATIHLTQPIVDSSIAAAINLIKDGGDGSTLPVDYATLKKAADAITGVKATLTTFLEGEDDGGDIDRLIELVKAIGDNKDSIDALTADKVATADIVDALTSDDAEKVLSAAQGKALKTLIDALETSLNTALDDAVSALEESIGGIDTREWAGTVTEVPEEWPAGVNPGGIIWLISE